MTCSCVTTVSLLPWLTCLTAIVSVNSFIRKTVINFLLLNWSTFDFLWQQMMYIFTRINASRQFCTFPCLYVHYYLLKWCPILIISYLLGLLFQLLLSNWCNECISFVWQLKHTFFLICFNWCWMSILNLIWIMIRRHAYHHLVLETRVMATVLWTWCHITLSWFLPGHRLYNLLPWH